MLSQLFRTAFLPVTVLAHQQKSHSFFLISCSSVFSQSADATFLHTFLNTYRSFISPASLIDKLIFRYNQFSNSSTERTDAIRQAVASKVVTFIVLVVNEF